MNRMIGGGESFGALAETSRVFERGCVGKLSPYQEYFIPSRYPPLAAKKRVLGSS